MVRAIVVAKDKLLESVVIAKEQARTLRIGDALVAQCELDLDYYGFIPAGETARVVSVCPDRGHVELEFTRPQEALYDWRNRLLLVPFDTPCWIAGLALVCAKAAQYLEHLAA